MLQTMRNHTSGFLAVVLFGLLILSFAIWGIQDVLNAGGNRAVARIDGKDIGVSELQSRVSELAALSGRPSSMIPAPLVLDQIVTEYALAAHADDMGIAFGRESVTEVIAQSPLFQGADGNFDPNVYAYYLGSMRNGLSDAAYREEIARGMAEIQFRALIGRSAAYPGFQGELRDGFQRERRVAEALRIPYGHITEVEAPGTEEMEAYLQQNRIRYMAPEIREISMLYIDEDEFRDSLPVSDEEIEAAYAERASMMENVTRYRYRQVSLVSEARAAELRDKIIGGMDFEAAVAEVTANSGVVIETDLMEPSGLFPASLRMAAENLALGQVSDPVETGGIAGWSLIQPFDSVTGAAPLDDAMREDIADELRILSGQTALMQKLNSMQDALAGGATLEELAEDAGVTLLRFDATRQSASSTPEADLSGIDGLREILDKAFSLSPGGSSGPSTLRDAPHYTLTVTDVTPSRPFTLSEVEFDIRETMMAERKARAVTDLANAMLARLREGESLYDLAAEQGLSVTLTDPLSRRPVGGAPDVLGSTGMTRLFQLAETGDAVHVTGTDGESIIRLVAIEPGDPALAEVNITAEQDRLRDGFAADLFELLGRQMKTEHGLEVNAALLSQLSSASN